MARFHGDNWSHFPDHGGAATVCNPPQDAAELSIQLQQDLFKEHIVHLEHQRGRREYVTGCHQRDRRECNRQART